MYNFFWKKPSEVEVSLDKVEEEVEANPAEGEQPDMEAEFCEEGINSLAF